MTDDSDKKLRREEGASASSLVAVHKLRSVDKAYDMQLLRDLALANVLARTYPQAAGSVASIPAVITRKENETVEEIVEGDGMNLGKFAALALTGLVSTCSIARDGAETSRHDTHTKTLLDVSSSKVGPAASKVRPTLGPEFNRGESFVEFRKKLLAAGWSPVANPNCHEVVLGAVFESLCKKAPDLISCRMCDITPEIFRSTSDGYSVMRYQKQGVFLSVTAYGDVEDMDFPGNYGFDVTDWRYDESIDVKLLDTAEAK